MKLKVCGLKYQENIEAIIKLSVNYIGFIFYKNSPRYMDANLSFDFVRSIPKHIKKVGVFVNENSYSILNSVAHYNLDIVQLHGDESEEVCQELKAYVSVIKAFRINDEFKFDILNKYLTHVDYFLFDTDTNIYGGSGTQFNWQKLEEYKLKKPFFLTGGIGLESVTDILKFKHSQFYAVDVNSKFEIEPGLKDLKKVKQFITKLKENDNT